jgi:hypothetical protein
VSRRRDSDWQQNGLGRLATQDSTSAHMLAALGDTLCHSASVEGQKKEMTIKRENFAGVQSPWVESQWHATGAPTEPSRRSLIGAEKKVGQRADRYQSRLRGAKGSFPRFRAICSGLAFWREWGALEKFPPLFFAKLHKPRSRLDDSQNSSEAFSEEGNDHVP